MGALLAVVARAGVPTAAIERFLRFTALPTGIVGLVLVADSPHLVAVLGETLLALVFLWLVAGASHGFGGLGRRVLEAKPMLYAGKISYGIYVYHLLVPGILGPGLAALGVRLQPKGAVEFAVYSVISVGFASLSWWCFENPVNALKRHIAYPA